MKPREKAAELVSKYTMHSYRGSVPLNIHVKSIKECALIAVDEILKSVGEVNWPNEELTDFTNYFEFWEEVKQEIEKL